MLSNYVWITKQQNTKLDAIRGWLYFNYLDKMDIQMLSKYISILVWTIDTSGQIPCVCILKSTDKTSARFSSCFLSAI